MNENSQSKSHGFTAIYEYEEKRFVIAENRNQKVDNYRIKSRPRDDKVGKNLFLNFSNFVRGVCLRTIRTTRRVNVP